jgi:hypothetical protein
MAAQSKTISMLGGRLDASPLDIACADFVKTLRRLFDPYRPELHYMRGPGPKWHAKHDGAAVG